MLYHRTGYKAYDVGIWLDYLELLDHFGMDYRNPSVALPIDLDKAHDRLSARRRLEHEIEAERRRKELDRAKIDAFMGKRMFFNQSFQNDRIKVVVLASLAEYKNEGDAQHHCVYTNEYYAKKSSLVLSARMIGNEDVPVETIEISLENGSILQCFGKYNKPTEYHDEIICLVKQNAVKMIKSVTSKQV